MSKKEVTIIVRPEVACFAVEMERMLARNDYKVGWKRCSKTFLDSKLREETGEVLNLLSLPHKELHHPAIKLRVLEESADVANIAMMIADNFGGLPK